MGIFQVNDEDVIYGLEVVDELFEFVFQNVDVIFEVFFDFFKVCIVVSDIFQNFEILFFEFLVLVEGFCNQFGFCLVSLMLVFIILVVMVVIVVMIGFVFYCEVQECLLIIQEQNEQNQNVIL